MKKAITLLVGAIVAQGFAANAMAEGPIDGKIYGKINTAGIAKLKERMPFAGFSVDWAWRFPTCTITRNKIRRM